MTLRRLRGIVAIAVGAGGVPPLGAQGTDSVIHLDAIVVTAARRAERLKNTVVQTELISRRDIEASGAADVASLLAERSGFQIDGGVPAGAGVLLQGLGAQRVLILLDGRPLVGRVNGNFDLSRIPTSMVERIEVVKGPQSTLYGSDAMGGVVNIITRRPPDAGLDWRAEGTLGTQSRRELAAGASGAAAGGRLGFTSDFGLRGVDLAPGVAGDAGTFADRWHASPTLTWRPSRGPALEASGLLISERQRYRTGQLFNFADNAQWDGRLGATWSAGAGHFAPVVSWSRFDHLSRTATGPVPASDSGERDVQQLAQAEATYGGLVGPVLLDAGLELRHEDIRSGRVSGGRRSTDGVAPYAQVTWARGPVTLTPGARLSWSEQWGTAFTPRLAVLVRPMSRLAIRGAIGRGFRAPDFKELYLDFVNAAVGYAVMGNPALRPEQSVNVSTSVEWAGTRLYGRVTGFANTFKNFIETSDPDVTGTYTYENIAGGHTAGVEVETGIGLGRARLDAGYGYLNTRDDRTGGALLGRPPHSAHAALTGPLPLGVVGSFAVTGSSGTPVQRSSDGTITAWRPAFARLDLRVERVVTGGVSVSLGVDDLLDQQAGPNWPGFTGRQLYVRIARNSARHTPAAGLR